MSYLFKSAFAVGIFFASFAFADEANIKDLQKQIDVLKQQMQQISPSSSDTTVGGYGEILYNHFSKETSRSQVDLARAVLFIGHRFSDQLSFQSEIEWEHAVTSSKDDGESEIEQDYLNYQVNKAVNVKAGLFLMPFGFLNTAHEPPVFYGVERNEVETRIIPSTWREGGVGVYGTTDTGWNWDAGITTGFYLAKTSETESPLHGMHQELQNAKAHDAAIYGAINYIGLSGLTLGGALFTGDSSQGNAEFVADPSTPDFGNVRGRVTLWDAHARWRANGLDVQALYAKGTIGDAQKIDQTLTAFPARALVPEEFFGWLTQVAYTFWQAHEMSVSPFVRYEQFNTQSKMPDGFAAKSENADRVWTVGLSFKPHSQVVVKTDYQKYTDNALSDRFNIGLGYMF